MIKSWEPLGTALTNNQPHTTSRPHWQRGGEPPGPGELYLRNRRRSLPLSVLPLQTQPTHKAFLLLRAPGERMCLSQSSLPKVRQCHRGDKEKKKTGNQFHFSVINSAPAALQIDYVHYLFEQLLEPSSLNTSLYRGWLSLKDCTLLTGKGARTKICLSCPQDQPLPASPTSTPST